MPKTSSNAGTFTVTDASGQDHKLNANQSYLDRVSEGMTLDSKAAKQAQATRKLHGFDGGDTPGGDALGNGENSGSSY